MKNPSCYPDYDFFCIVISAITGNFFLILIIGVPVLLFFLIRNYIKNQPEPEPEPETFSTGTKFSTIIIGYIILVVVVLFFDLQNTNIGNIILIPGKIFMDIIINFVIPTLEWMFQEKS